MKRSLSIFIVPIVSAILSGCVISISPKEDPVVLSPKVAKTFTIPVFSGTEDWALIFRIPDCAYLFGFREDIELVTMNQADAYDFLLDQRSKPCESGMYWLYQ
jgi:hypothetical protein